MQPSPSAHHHPASCVLLRRDHAILIYLVAVMDADVDHGGQSYGIIRRPPGVSLRPYQKLKTFPFATTPRLQCLIASIPRLLPLPPPFD